MELDNCNDSSGRGGVLYLCGTPLGNLEDITLRVLRVLKEVDLIAAEDTRRTRKLLAHYGISTPLTSFYEFNQKQKIPFLLSELKKGKSIALVTDAGMPGVADPGYLLVKAVLEQGYRVEVVPGPSAVIAALVVSGFSPYPFYFQGFLPRQEKARRELLRELKEEPRTGVFFEVPHRLSETLEDFREIWGGERKVAVARELTKQFEEVVRGTFAEVIAHFAENPPRGELTLVTEGLSEERGRNGEVLLQNPGAVVSAVEALVKAGVEVQTALKAVAKALGVSKSEVYKVYKKGFSKN
ncbi:MAG: Ribosomal RNA small subunit methyltransferase I [Thermoanaerobacterales bacterium 50_218]|nr:MAG: Ribosomal RNA small subunit methyltransferase I [Thermoanaerobacterales bacterium 50_218]